MLRRTLLAATPLLLARSASAQPKPAQPKTLRVVMQSDLKIVDPVWTTAYIVRNHGFLIYDMLFALDSKLAVRPQMVDRALSGVASGVARRDARYRVQRAIGWRGVCPPAAGSSATARTIATDA